MKQKILDTLERVVLTHPKMPIALHLELALDIKLPFSESNMNTNRVWILYQMTIY